MLYLLFLWSILIRYCGFPQCPAFSAAAVPKEHRLKRLRENRRGPRDWYPYHDLGNRDAVIDTLEQQGSSARHCRVARGFP
jgi:hypothetical protein